MDEGKYYEQRMKSIEDQIANNQRYFEKIEQTLEKFTEIRTFRIEKIDEMLERVTDVSNELKTISSVHEERLNQHDTDIKDILSQIQTVHGRIDSVKTDISNWKESNNRRLMEMEKWRWVVIGGISIAVFAVSNWTRIGAVLGSF